MSTVTITDPIIDYDGKPIKDGEIKLSIQIVNDFRNAIIEKRATPEQCLDALEKELKKDPLTYRTVINNALNSQIMKADGKPEIMSAGDKTSCYEITKKLFASDKVSFTPKQIIFICERVDKVYITPIIYGRVCELLGNLSSSDQSK